jgi:hypothetical protein
MAAGPVRVGKGKRKGIAAVYSRQLTVDGLQ